MRANPYLVPVRTPAKARGGSNNENDYKRPNYARGHLHEVGMHAGRNFVNFLSGKGFESATRRQ